VLLREPISRTQQRLCRGCTQAHDDSRLGLKSRVSPTSRNRASEVSLRFLSVWANGSGARLTPKVPDGSRWRRSHEQAGSHRTKAPSCDAGRDAQGQFAGSQVSGGRSLVADRRSKSKTVAPKGSVTRGITLNTRPGRESSEGQLFEEVLQLLPGLAVQNGSFFKARATRLVNASPNERQLARTMGISVDGDEHARGAGLARHACHGRLRRVSQRQRPRPTGSASPSLVCSVALPRSLPRALCAVSPIVSSLSTQERPILRSPAPRLARASCLTPAAGRAVRRVNLARQLEGTPPHFLIDKWWGVPRGVLQSGRPYQSGPVRDAG
jgi:hypothetical protein